MEPIRGSIPSDIECLSYEHEIIPIGTQEYLNPTELSFNPLKYGSSIALPQTPIIITSSNGAGCLGIREEIGEVCN